MKIQIQSNDYLIVKRGKVVLPPDLLNQSIEEKHLHLPLLIQGYAVFEYKLGRQFILYNENDILPPSCPKLVLFNKQNKISPNERNYLGPQVN